MKTLDPRTLSGPKDGWIKRNPELEIPYAVCILGAFKSALIRNLPAVCTSTYGFVNKFFVEKLQEVCSKREDYTSIHQWI